MMYVCIHVVAHSLQSAVSGAIQRMPFYRGNFSSSAVRGKHEISHAHNKPLPLGMKTRNTYHARWRSGKRQRGVLIIRIEGVK